MKNKCEGEDDLDLFLNGPNFTPNRIIIPMLLVKAIFFNKLLSRGYIFQLTKYEHQGVSQRIDSDNTNFSSVDLAE